MNCKEWSEASAHRDSSVDQCARSHQKGGELGCLLVTLSALCSWLASYSTGGVSRATIRSSNSPPSSDFKALTRSWLMRVRKG